MIYHDYFYSVTISKLYKYLLEDKVEALQIYIWNKTVNNFIELILGGKFNCFKFGLKYE